MNIQEIEKKLDKVIYKLMNLDPPVNEEELAKGGEAKGFYERDFGIKEWDWPQGIGLYGLRKVMESYDNEEYYPFLKDWTKDNFEIGLPSRNINTTTPLLTLIDVADKFQDKELENLCLDWASWIMDNLPRTKEGGFQHVTSASGDRQGVRLNDGEIWMDTMFMTVLFLNKMGQKYNRQDWIDESLKQVLIHIKYLYDKKSSLFYHGWTFKERNNFGGIFWCRGNSWFTLGIMEYISMFKGTLNRGVKEYLVDTFKAQANSLKELQGKNGLWHTVLTDAFSYEESSGSAGILAGIIRGMKLGILDDSFILCIEKGMAGLLKQIGDDGTVRNVSGGTGMGYDADHYKNILIAPMAYGQALTIIALAEYISYKSTL